MSEFYTLIARHGRGRGRPCALVQAIDEGAAMTAFDRMDRDGTLSFVRQGSSFSVRRSSRGEVAHLVSFLATANRAHTDLHSRTDLDSLISRRQRLIHAFFTSLYLAPDQLKKRNATTGHETDHPAKPEADNRTGSGIETTDETEGDGEMPDRKAHDEAMEAPSPDGHEAESDAPGSAVDDSNLETGLARLLGSTEANDGGSGRDMPIDLGDE